MQPLNLSRILTLFAFCLALVSFPSVGLLPTERSPAEAERIAERVLERAIIIDTHADTPQMILDENYNLADPESPFMISIPKMQTGRLGAEFFSIWVETNWPRGDVIRRSLALIEAVYGQIERHRDALGLATTAEEILRLHRAKKIAVLLGMEGGHQIQNDLRVLGAYHRLGVRYLTLTHTASTDWADSSGSSPRWNGLTEFGRAVVREMNRLGMIVDVSHVSDKTFYDTLAISQAPVLASHSSCRALCNAPRNLSDEMIRALAKNGGVMAINFYPAFLDPEFRQAQQKIAKEEDAAVRAARGRAAREGRRLTYLEETRIRWQFQARLPAPGLERVADHIDHAVKVGGVDHVGLGSDFDGVDAVPRGLEDISKLPDLVRELGRRGYSEQDLEKILGGNILRVLRQVEEVARELRGKS
jgi:membrane dipeptidase